MTPQTKAGRALLAYAPTDPVQRLAFLHALAAYRGEAAEQERKRIAGEIDAYIADFPRGKREQHYQRILALRERLAQVSEAAILAEPSDD